MNEQIKDGNDSKKGTGLFGSVTTTVLSLTALFIAVPALINAGIDVYKAVKNIPSSVYEETNDELFKKHFKDKPIVSQPIKITSSDVTVQMLLEVYDTGDIFVKYGDYSQWLPFKKIKTAANSIFPEVYADTREASSLQGMTIALVLPTIELNLNKIKQEKQIESSSKVLSPTIQREFLIAEMRDIHSNLFGPSSEVYEKTFSADEGYKITSYNFQSISQSHSNIDRIELLNDGKSVRIVFSISSGPAIDRWRGWIKGVLITKQEKAR